MVFQPFGYRFEIFSNLDPAEAKAAIRSKKTRILDVKNGARGWIAGPFICLWFSAFDRYGPMLFGLISSDNLGTRIHGRAGSDLNGVLMFTLLIPLMAWIVFMMIAEDQASSGQLLIIALAFLVGGPLIYWTAHKDRRDAEPLVRFLRKTLIPSAARSKSSMRATKVQTKFRLILNGDNLEGPVTEEAIQSAFMRVGIGNFMLIESGPQKYLQTAFRDGGYILEVRKGGPGEHYQAIRNGKVSGVVGQADAAFTFDEICEAMAAYVAGLEMPHFIRWQPLELQT